jgi:hypothetical protein
MSAAELIPGQEYTDKKTGDVKRPMYHRREDGKRGKLAKFEVLKKGEPPKDKTEPPASSASSSSAPPSSSSTSTSSGSGSSTKTGLSTLQQVGIGIAISGVIIAAGAAFLWWRSQE